MVDLEELDRRQKRKAGKYTFAEIDFATLENGLYFPCCHYEGSKIQKAKKKVIQLHFN